MRKLFAGSVEHVEIWKDFSKTEQLAWWEKNSGLSLYGLVTALNVLLEHRQEAMFQREVNKSSTPMSQTMLDTAVKDGKMSPSEVTKFTCTAILADQQKVPQDVLNIQKRLKIERKF